MTLGVGGRWVRWLALYFLPICLACVGPALALDLPPLTGRVIDEAALLKDSERATLDGAIADFDAKTGDQLILVTLKSLQGVSIEDFSRQLQAFWNLGTTGTNNGILLVVAPNAREARIEVSPALITVLPHSVSKDIVSKMVFALSSGKPLDGIKVGVDAIVYAVRFASICEPLKRRAYSILRSAGRAPVPFNHAFASLQELGKEMPAACPVMPRVFGGTITRIVPCYNNAIFIQLADGGNYVWTESTDTFRYGRPGAAKDFVMGVTGQPYYCVARNVPILVWPATSVAAMAERRYDSGDKERLIADEAGVR